MRELIIQECAEDNYSMRTDRHRQTDTQTNKQTDRQTQTDRQIDRHTGT